MDIKDTLVYKLSAMQLAEMDPHKLHEVVMVLAANTEVAGINKEAYDRINAILDKMEYAKDQSDFLGEEVIELVTIYNAVRFAIQQEMEKPDPTM